MKSQLEKATAFRQLHTLGGIFVTPNPWDAGSAILLEQLGFAALASTGAGHAFACGQPDNSLGRARMLAHLHEIAAATRLPVSADLENGFGDTPECVAETIRLAAATGIVGGSIEDAPGKGGTQLYPFALAVERIHAAVEAARTVGFPFTLTARCEHFTVSARPELDDTLRRLDAYAAVGADVVFAPGMNRLEDIASLVNTVRRPVNVMMGFAQAEFGVRELSAIGVRRVSVGGSLARVALAACQRAAEEILGQGRFGYADAAISGKRLNALFAARDNTAEGMAAAGTADQVRAPHLTPG